MSERLKRILLIIGFVLIVVVIAAALYIVFFRGAPEVVSPGTTGETIGEATTDGTLPRADTGTPVTITEPPSVGTQLPEASPVADGGLTETEALTTGRVVAATLTGGQDMAYYDRTDGRFYRVNSEGVIERLSDTQFPRAETIAWNNEGEKAVIEFPDGSNIVYDFDNETQVTLPAHWEDFGFSPSTDEIIAKSIGIDPGNRSLVITSTDGSRTQSIAALGDNADKVDINWSPNDQVVAFSDTGPSVSGFGRKLMIPIGKNQENFRGITVEGVNFLSQWNPQGNKLLFSSAGSQNGYRPTLWVVDGNPNALGENRRSLGVNTWADKCTFANNSTLYCAVPQQLGPNSGLQRALADSIPDDIYRINIETGATVRVAVPQVSQSIDSLHVNEDQSRLFFTNADTGVLQQLRLE